MFARFSTGTQKVVVRAQAEARELRHNWIGTEHLLLGLLNQEETRLAQLMTSYRITPEKIRTSVIEILGPGVPDKPDAEALGTIGIDLEAVRRQIEASFGKGALERTATRRTGNRKGLASASFLRRPCTYADQPRLTPRAKKALHRAFREAGGVRGRTVEPEHVLLGILSETQGLAARLLEPSGLTYSRARSALAEEEGRTA